MDKATNQTTFSYGFYITILVVIYTFCFFLWYGETALGIAPVLDSKENIHLAQAIAERTLPAEPFYRAPAYPALLSVFFSIGFDESTIPWTARFLNFLLHCASTLLIYSIVRDQWNHKKAAAAAALLFGLNPVVLHFAADPLDITLAMTALLVALKFALKAINAESSTHYSILAGLFLGLGCITRPHLLTIAIACVFVFACIRVSKTIWIALGTFSMLFLVGISNFFISNQFVLMPTQGAYNLWAANKPEANGKYLSQSVYIRRSEIHDNPTKLESRILYRQETGNITGPIEQAEVNAYWREKTLKTIIADPGPWLKLMFLKGYYLMNNYEQYNNKTYVVHKSRSPWLKFNPLNWVIIFLLGIGGLILTWRSPGTRLLAIVLLFYAAGVLLFFVSARFRLPMVPILIILAGAGFANLSKLMHFRKQHWIGSACLLTSLFGISVSQFANVNDPITVAEDFLLIAQASSELGQDNEAKHWAGQALAVNPAMQSARELICISKYNIMLNNIPAMPSLEQLKVNIQQCLSVGAISDQALYIAANYYNLVGQTEQAKALWYQLLDNNQALQQSVLAALIMTHNLRPQDRGILSSIPIDNKRTLLLLAEALQGNRDLLKILRTRNTVEELEQHQRILEHLFTPLQAE